MKRLLALLAAFSIACAPAIMSNRIQMEIDHYTANGLLVDRFMVSGDSHKEHLFRLENWLEGERKTSVTFMADMSDKLGLTPGGVGAARCLGPRSDTCEIVIEENQSVNSQFSTLLHEAVHTFHGPQSLLVGETLAETVAYEAAREVGLNTQRESISYLARIPAPARDFAYDLFKERIRDWTQVLVKASRGS